MMVEELTCPFQVRDRPTGSLMSPTSRPLSTCRVAMVPGETRRARWPGAQHLASLPPPGPGVVAELGGKS
jgi:hypothetical protein